MSALSSAPSVWTNSSAANFRAWGSLIAARLLAGGMVKTADTGQIDWTTVAAPGGVSTYPGYEIWRFADTMQATAPVYMKFSYGAGAANLNNPGIRVVFGSGSDGVGNLTGVLSANVLSEAGASAVPVTFYTSSGTNRFIFCVVGAAGANLHFLSFERSLDSTGAVTAEGVLIASKTSPTNLNSYVQWAWDCTTGDKTASESSIGCLFPIVGTGVTGTQIATYPVFFTKGVFMYPGMNMQGYFNANITALSQITVPVYGANRIYLPLGSTQNFTATSFRVNVASALMIRYE